jgi:hypothetical protein
MESQELLLMRSSRTEKSPDQIRLIESGLTLETPRCHCVAKRPKTLAVKYSRDPVSPSLA